MALSMGRSFEPMTTEESDGARAVLSAVLMVHATTPVVAPLTEGQACIVGRCSPADVIVDESSVSRAHTRIVWEDGMFSVADLGSRNGTWVRGQRIEAPVRLMPGEPFQIGSLTASLSVTVHVDGLTAR